MAKVARRRLLKYGLLALGVMSGCVAPDSTDVDLLIENTDEESHRVVVFVNGAPTVFSGDVPGGTSETAKDVVTVSDTEKQVTVEAIVDDGPVQSAEFDLMPSFSGRIRVRIVDGTAEISVEYAG